jgi:hopene-associated glycosyltransferase HpnB
MFSAFLIAGVLCVAIWAYLLLAHGRFWQVPRVPSLPPGARFSSPGVPSFSAGFVERVGQPRSVAVVIPARNEADVIGRAVGSLLRQSPTLPPKPGEEDGALVLGPIHIFVVDDNSTDGTADAARQAAGAQTNRLTVIQGRPLPPGWSGKLWAVQQGVEQAITLQPDFLLLTDADVEHDSDNVGCLIKIADGGGYGLASFMVKLYCRSMAERLLIPAFVFFFFMLYPPRWIRDPRRKTAGAAGGCILIRPEALEHIGGIAAIRHEIIDDCALARAVKCSGGKVWLGATADTHSVRPYTTFGEIEHMISRTAFNQLRHSFWLLLGTVAGMLLMYILPLPLIVSGSPKLALFGAMAFALMFVTYLPMVRFYGLNPLWALTLPFSAGFYTCATIHSAVKYWTGRGGEWKDRAQDVR